MILLPASPLSTGYQDGFLYHSRKQGVSGPGFPNNGRKQIFLGIRRLQALLPSHALHFFQYDERIIKHYVKYSDINSLFEDEKLMASSESSWFFGAKDTLLSVSLNQADSSFQASEGS